MGAGVVEEVTAPFGEALVGGEVQAQRQGRQAHQFVQNKRHQHTVAALGIVFGFDLGCGHEQAAHQRRDLDDLTARGKAKFFLRLDPDGDCRHRGEHAEIVLHRAWDEDRAIRRHHPTPLLGFDHHHTGRAVDQLRAVVVMRRQHVADVEIVADRHNRPRR